MMWHRLLSVPFSFCVDNHKWEGYSSSNRRDVACYVSTTVLDTPALDRFLYVPLMHGRRMARRSHPRRRRDSRRRRGPGLAGEIKEIEQIGLGRITFGQRGQAEPLLHKVDHSRVIHSRVAHVVASRERRNNKVRHTEPELSAKALMSRCGCIGCMSARTVGPQIAVVG